MKKKSAIFTIIACSVAVVILCSVLAVGLSGNFFSIGDLLDRSHKADGEKSYTYAWNVENLSEIDISWVNGNVEIIETTGNQIILTETANRSLEESEKLRMSGNNKKLKVQWNERLEVLRFFENLEKSLVLEVPADCLKGLDELSCNNTSGDVILPGMTVEEIAVETTSGDMELSQISAENGKFSSASGSISLEGVRCTEKLKIVNTSGDVNAVDCSGKEGEISTVSGDLRFAGEAEELEVASVSAEIQLELSGCPDKLDVESVSGNQQIILPGNSQFTADYSSVSGKFSSDFQITKNGSETSGKAVCGNGTSVFSLASTSGKIEILRG